MLELIRVEKDLRISHEGSKDKRLITYHFYYRLW